MQKRAQAWGFDLIIATMIFLAGIIIFYIYSLNYPSEGRDTLDSLFYEGGVIAESLLSEGFPDDWTEDNVIKIGLLNNGKVNETKLERLYNLTNTTSGYSQSLSVFNTKYNYYFNFSESMVINSAKVDYIGKKDPIVENLIKITRFTAYKNKPVSLNIYIWES